MLAAIAPRARPRRRGAHARRPRARRAARRVRGDRPAGRAARRAPADPRAGRRRPRARRDARGAAAGRGARPHRRRRARARRAAALPGGGLRRAGRGRRAGGDRPARDGRRPITFAAEWELVRAVARADASVGRDLRRPPQRGRPAGRGGARAAAGRRAGGRRARARCASASGAPTRPPARASRRASSRPRTAPCSRASRPSARARAAFSGRSCWPAASSPDRRCWPTSTSRDGRRDRSRRGSARPACAPPRATASCSTAPACSRSWAAPASSPASRGSGATRMRTAASWAGIADAAAEAALALLAGRGEPDDLAALAAGRIARPPSHDRRLDDRARRGRRRRSGRLAASRSRSTCARRWRAPLGRCSTRRPRLRLAAVRDRRRARPRPPRPRGVPAPASPRPAARPRRPRGHRGAPHVSTRLERDYFEDLYAADADPWVFATSPYEAAKYDATRARRSAPAPLRAAGSRPGCSIGVLTRAAGRALRRAAGGRPRPSARSRAPARGWPALPHVRVERRTLPEELPAGPFDLIVCSEVLYYWSRELLLAALPRARPARWPRAAACSPSTGGCRPRRIRCTATRSTTCCRASVRAPAWCTPSRAPSASTASTAGTGPRERGRDRRRRAGRARDRARLSRRGRRAPRRRCSASRPHRPYQRPPLTKELPARRDRAGRARRSRTRRGSPSTTSSWCSGRRRRGSTPTRGRLPLNDGRELDFDGLRARDRLRADRACRCPAPTIPTCCSCGGSRTPSACASGSAGGTRVVVVGSGFIGCEAAASLALRGARRDAS